MNHNSSNTVTSLMLLMAEMMPMSALIAELKKAIDEYNEAVLLNGDITKAESHITFYCIMVLQKTSKRSVVDTIDDMSKIESAMNLLNPEKQ